ncbi:MAG: acetyl-CoA carboxylase biotin carboxylase subunit [Candidatus Hydrogenedens sp.]|nr:acetyl-CoA carboxylase biotin carboxylase subunit [Candidatus Hydrogenedens sp.]
MSRRFSKVLIANRGEIACRVIRSAKAEGYGTVAVYSDADAQALHVAMAAQSVHIGPSPVGASYLDAAKIIDAARRSGADALHPGYGFLSENAAFAAACKEAGIVFIGPPSAAIQVMGDKAEAKRLMRKANVPCVPGYEGEAQDDATLKAEVEKIGYPVLLKAAAGGGGRGMRTVRSAAELDDGIATARSEAKSAFGSDTLIIEKLVENARHVEIQVLADEHGNCIHLGERDCSVQRRHQKIVEESPCPVMTPELREAMGAAAVNAALAVGYANAGTVEFLLDDDQNFYFLEMNTRLQVEHPVTEMVTGLDLVALQLAIAQGEPLPLTQADVSLNGHAIEVRLYAEDPANNYAPQVGTIHTWQPAENAGVRVDHGLRDGAQVTPFYDAMIAKVIAWGKTRDESRNRLLAALHDTVALGVYTNADLLRGILAHETFAAGSAKTNFIEGSGLLDEKPAAPGLEHFLAAAAILIERDAAGVSPLLKGWRSSGPSTVPLKLECNEEAHLLAVQMNGRQFELTQGEETARIQVDACGGGVISLHDDGHTTTGRYALHENDLYLSLNGRVDHFRDITFAPPSSEAGAADGVLKAPMVGQVKEVNVKPGDRVAKDDVVVVLEAMKIINMVTAPFDGEIESVNVTAGGQVAAGDVLLKIKVEAEDGEKPESE